MAYHSFEQMKKKSTALGIGIIGGAIIILVAGIGISLYIRSRWGGFKETNSEYPQDWPGRELYLH